MTPTVPQLRPRSTMTGDCKPTRKRAYPDENTDNSTPASPRKRPATGSGRSPTSTATDVSSGNTPQPHIVKSPYFSPPKKTHDCARKKRLLAASRSLLNENNRFIQRLSATASPAGPAGIRPNVPDTAAAITKRFMSGLSKAKSRKRKTRRDPEHITPEEPGELPPDKADLTALERQVRVYVIHACFNLRYIVTDIEHKGAAPRCCPHVRGWL